MKVLSLLVLSRESGNVIPVCYLYIMFPYSLLRTSKLGSKVCTRFSCSPRMEGAKRRLTGPINPFKSYSEMNRKGPQLHDSDGVSHGVPLGIHAWSIKIKT